VKRKEWEENLRSAEHKIGQTKIKERASSSQWLHSVKFKENEPERRGKKKSDSVKLQGRRPGGGGEPIVRELKFMEKAED